MDTHSKYTKNTKHTLSTPYKPSIRKAHAHTYLKVKARGYKQVLKLRVEDCVDLTERLLLLFSETRLAGEVVVVRMVRVVGVEGIAVEVEVEIVGLLFGVVGLIESLGSKGY